MHQQNKSIEVKFFIIIFFLSFIVSTISANKNRTDSLELALLKVNDDTTRVGILNALAYEYRMTDTKKSNEYLDKSIEISLNINFEYGLMNAYSIKGIICKKLAKYDEAIYFNQQSMKFAELTGNKLKIGTLYNNIANIYSSLSENKVAIKYYHKALKIYRDLKNNMQEELTLYNLGARYEILNKLDSAYFFYSQSLTIAEEISDSVGIYYVHNGLGGIEATRKNFDKALFHQNKALEITLNSKDIAGNSMITCELGKIYIFKKQFDVAIKYLKASLAYADSVKYLENIREAYKYLSAAYEGKKEFNQSIIYLQKYVKINDSLFNMKMTEQFAEMETKYKTEKKEQEISLLNKEKNMQRNLIYVFVAGFILVFVLLMFAVKFYLGKKKANVVLKQSNQEILQQKEEIAAQSELLEKTIVELEKLSIVASETDNAVVLIAADGELEWANYAFTKMYGYTLEMFKQERGSNIKTVSANPQVEESIKICREKKQSVVYSNPTTTRLGKKIWVQTTLTPVFDSNYNISKLVAIDTDITQIKEAEMEILSQKDELRLQSEILAITNKELGYKNIQLMDSIEYAKLIQKAILPSKQQLNALLPEHFIFYQPRNVVSGDFFWLYEKNNSVYFAVIDCTGHGVPGAFMSMIGNTLLNEIIIDSNVISPSEILTKLNEKVISALRQNQEDIGSQDDGMDMAICCISHEKKEVQIATANHKVFIVPKSGDVFSVGSDFYSIGGYFNIRIKPQFTNHCIPIEHGSMIYMFTDGYQDQFGGSERKKFMSDKFKKLLIENSHLSMNEQKNILSDVFNKWKAKEQQMDDVTVAGIRI